MQLDRLKWVTRCVRRPLIGVITALAISGSVVATTVHADPSDDAMAKLNELSRQAEQTTEAMHTAQLNLSKKLVALKAADAKHAADEAAQQAAKAQLANYQGSVDKLAAAMYMGGRTDGMSAIMTADSPQHLIDEMSVQKVVAGEMAAQMNGFRTLAARASAAEQASAKSAADARTAAEQAAAVRAEVQAKQSKLQMQIAVVKSQYLALSPGQRIALAAPDPVPAALPPGDGAPNALPPDGGIGAPNALPPDADTAVQAMPDAMVPPGDISSLPDAAVPAPGGAGEGALAVQAALTRVGSPYVWGAAGPNAFDCSGLVMWAFQQAGISLPHSSQALASGGQPVSMSDLQPGDVVTYYSDASHTGIYVGDGMVVHSSTYGQPVRVVPIGAAGPINNVRRY
ncbi:MAG: C40 family peptidase [Mycobacteriaceae bacterium]|nr:C40 family peptidase [Mycobacteriaceae bacterium]